MSNLIIEYDEKGIRDAVLSDAIDKFSKKFKGKIKVDESNLNVKVQVEEVSEGYGMNEYIVHKVKAVASLTDIDISEM